MCKVGDIVFIRNYVTYDGFVSNGHPFIVVDDQNDQISGIDFDLVCSVMSSFEGKSKEYKEKKLSYKENLHFGLDDGNRKDGYVKADQMYLFRKSKIQFMVVGTVDEEFIEILIELITELKREGLLKLIDSNIR
jgi:hypothetical protein